MASLVWAICSLIQRRLIGVPVLTIYAWVGLVGAVVLGPLAFVAEPAAFASIPDLPLSTFGWILFSALGSTVIGQGAMSILLQRHPVSTVVPLTLPTPGTAEFSPVPEPSVALLFGLGLGGLARKDLPERTFWALAVAGGAIGSWFGSRRFDPTVIKRLLAGEKVEQKTSGLSAREWRELMSALGQS